MPEITYTSQIFCRMAGARPLSVVLFFLSAVLLFSVGNWSLPLIDRDEPRFAEASREMRQSGDFLIPRLNGEYRFDKPPLIYWCQVLTYDGLGETDFAARFPSVIFAALASVATWMFGSRIFGPRVGIWSGIIFATSLQVFIHARAAVADMPLVLFFLTATWADWERSRNSRSPFWWWIFYLSLGLGFLAKGPIALLPAFFAPVRWFLNRAPYRIELRSALGGGLVVLIVIGLWGVPALIATHGAYLQVGLGKHVLQRSLQPMESHGGAGLAGYLLFLPFYLAVSFFSFFPWCLFLPGCFRRLSSYREPDENFLLGPILLVLCVFTLIQTKLPHYVLPAYPMLAILVARQAAESRWRLGLLGFALILYLLIALVGFRIVEPEFLSKRIAGTALPLIFPETRTGSIGYDEQSQIWYLRAKTRPFHRHLDSSSFSSFMEQPGPALCVVNKKAIGQVNVNSAWQTFEVSGHNFAHWKVRSIPVFGIRIPMLLPESLDLVTIIKK
jgi:4-amino-4-deoxy-L-arabinose transferase-like glycosyltransferase